MSYDPPPEIEDPSALTEQRWLSEFALRLESNYEIDITQFEKFLKVAPKGWSEKIKTQRHPLFRAVEWPTTALLSAMVESGVSLPKTPEGHETLLNRCISFGGGNKPLLPYIHLLEKIGVDIHARGFKDRTPLYMSVSHRDDDAVLYFIEKGVDLDVFAFHGQSMINTFLNRDNASMIEKLSHLFLEDHTPTELVDMAAKKNAIQCLEKMLEWKWEVSDETLLWMEEKPEMVDAPVKALIEQAKLSQHTPSANRSGGHYRI